MASETITHSQGSFGNILIVRDTVTHVIDHLHVDNLTNNNIRIVITALLGLLTMFDQRVPPGSNDYIVPGSLVWDADKSLHVATYTITMVCPG